MKPKLVAIRPSELVILAIHSLGKKSGSSQKEIIRFISRKYGLAEGRIAPQVVEALKRGLTFGILAFRNGRYELEDVPEHPSKDAGEIVERSYESVSVATGRQPKQKRKKSLVEEKLSQLIEREIRQWKKEKGIREECDSNGQKQLDNPEEKSAPEVAAITDNLPRAASDEAKTQAVSAAEEKRATVSGIRKSEKKTVPRQFRKTSRGRKPSVGATPKKRGRPPKKQGIPARVGFEEKRKRAGKSRPRATAGAKSKACPIICPKGCPKSIERNKRGRWKEIPSRTPNNTVSNNNKSDMTKTRSKPPPYHPCENLGFRWP